MFYSSYLQLDNILANFISEDVQLSHVSCGLDVVWACDTVGNMHMTVSSPHAMATATFSPVWIRVPISKEQKKIFFIKVQFLLVVAFCLPFFSTGLKFVSVLV